MRKIIAALRVSVDGFIEGRNGELDWVESWDDSFDLLPQIDICLLGRGMYAGYEQYWRAILANPSGVLAFTGKAASKDEIESAHFADRTPHVVVSRTLQEASWHNTRIVRDVEAIAKLKQLPGKDIYAVGGAALVASLMNHGLIDELRLSVAPIVLGAGKALFANVERRHSLQLLGVRPMKSGAVRLTYGVSR
jgi:dihydrofolate reductase